MWKNASTTSFNFFQNSNMEMIKFQEYRECWTLKDLNLNRA